MRTNIKILLVALMAMVGVHQVLAWNWSATLSMTIYYDFTAVPGGGGVNWCNGTNGSTGYDQNGAGKIISHTFTSTFVNDDCTLFNTEYAKWPNIKWSNPEGKNCVKVDANGRTYTWTTYPYGHTVTYSVNNGSLGSVTTHTQGGANFTSGSTSITEGTTVRLVAEKSGTNVFVGWKNSSDEYVSYDADYTFSMPDDNVSLTAVFEVKRQVDGCANCFTVE